MLSCNVGILGMFCIRLQVSKKIQRIQEVWASDRGIIMLYCFQNLIHAEACAREACMINAIGMAFL